GPRCCSWPRVGLAATLFIAAVCDANAPSVGTLLPGPTGVVSTATDADPSGPADSDRAKVRQQRVKRRIAHHKANMGHGGRDGQSRKQSAASLAAVCAVNAAALGALLASPLVSRKIIAIIHLQNPE